jgi:hypothetical protein
MHDSSLPYPECAIAGAAVGAEPQNTTTARDCDYIEIAGKRYLTQPGLARQVKKTERTVARWDALRIGPPKIKVGRLTLYDPDKIQNWLAEHEEARPIRRARGR